MCEHKGSILIAEDDLSQLHLMSHDFEDAGYQVLSFTDGKGVFDKVLTYKPDLVVLDVILPEVNGWEIARQLHNNPDTRHIPVVMVSGVSLEEAKGHALVHGCIDFVEKPYNQESIMNKVSSYISMGRLKRLNSEMYNKL